jgi:hypothetical protein
VKHYRHHHAPPSPAWIRHARLDVIYIPPPWSFPLSTATLNWNNPTTRVDGTPLAPSDIASIDIFDSASAPPSTPIGSVQGAGTSFVTSLLTVGQHSFTVVVNDTAGHKSAPSNTAMLTVPATLAAPSAVTDLQATLNP